MTVPDEYAATALTLRGVPSGFGNVEVCTDDVPFLTSLGTSPRNDGRITDTLRAFCWDNHWLSSVQGFHTDGIVAIGKVKVDGRFILVGVKVRLNQQKWK